MKVRRNKLTKAAAVGIIGVALAHGAQADTIIDFDIIPVGLGDNDAVVQLFGDYADMSSDGVTVTGFGTPNIGLTWQATSAQWQYYIDSVWAAGQLDGAQVGDRHEVVFTPNSAAARVVVKSFNFHPYYTSDERYTYAISVLAGTNVVSGPIPITFLADASKAHPVSINHTGALGQTLKLRIARVASTLNGSEIEGSSQNIAADDIAFAQLPETTGLLVGPQVVSITPADSEVAVSAIPYYLAGITNGDTALVTSSIQLRLDGILVSPSPSISTADDLTNVTYQASGLLASGSTHFYTLSYEDSAASRFTNEVEFTVATYATLPASYTNSLGSAKMPGFTYRTVAAPAGTPTLESSLARARAQLDGTLIDPTTMMPYENAATPGPNGDGSYNITNVLNFDDDGIDSGNFTNDVAFPGLPTTGNNSFSTEALLYLELPAGYHRFGVNSDDGFGVSLLPPPGASGPPIVLGMFDDGRGADDTLFDFLVQTSGIYCFQVIYFETGGSANEEFFSVKLPAGPKILINDLTNPDAIKSFTALRIANIVRSGLDVVIQWVSGTPPFQLQFKNDITAAWGDLGAPTMDRSATVAIQPGAGFFRVVGQ